MTKTIKFNDEIRSKCRESTMKDIEEQFDEIYDVYCIPYYDRLKLRNKVLFFVEKAININNRNLFYFKKEL